jgi:ATP-binding cassette subfamily B protein
MPRRVRWLAGVTNAARIAWRAGARQLVWSILIAVASGLLPVMVAWGTKVLLDGAVAGSRGTVVMSVGVLALASIGMRLLPSAEGYVSAELQRRIAHAVQDELGRKVNGFRGVRIFEDPRFHDELQMAQQGGQAAPGRLVQLGAALVQQVVTILGFLTALLFVGPLLAAVVVIATAPALWAEFDLSRRRVAMLSSITPHERRRLFYFLLQNDPRAAREIRVFGLGEVFHGRLMSELRTAQAQERAVDRRALATQLGLALIGSLGIGLAFAMAAQMLLDGSIGVGDVAIVLAGLAGVQGAAAGIVSSAADLSENLLLFGYYRRFLAQTHDLPAVSAPAPASRLSGSIEFRGVWFRYREDLPWVLKDLDLTLTANEATALVGVNGSGKSTLVKLLCRFYDPERGQILWDGVDLRLLDVDQVRQRLSVVLQDFMRYELNARENVGVGSVDLVADMDAVVAAARLADVHETLEGLPQGYETMLTQMFADLADDDSGSGTREAEASAPPVGGVTLSGGQWQKVSLARMFMRTDADLVVLDEPHSSLDADAEHEIILRFREVLSGRTAVLISHRLNTVLLADKIVVMEGGRVADSGRHDELMARGGTYARMFTRQAASYRAT